MSWTKTEVDGDVHADDSGGLYNEGISNRRRTSNHTSTSVSLHTCIKSSIVNKGLGDLVMPIVNLLNIWSTSSCVCPTIMKPSFTFGWWEDMWYESENNFNTFTARVYRYPMHRVCVRTWHPVLRYHVLLFFKYDGIKHFIFFGDNPFNMGYQIFHFLVIFSIKYFQYI